VQFLFPFNGEAAIKSSTPKNGPKLFEQTIAHSVFMHLNNFLVVKLNTIAVLSVNWDYISGDDQ
jgi:hypothetical protein